MASRRILRAPALFFLAVTLFTSSAALAQPSPEDGRRAVELGKEAKAAYEQGRWAEALEKFKQADAIVHSPVFTLYVARTERRVGKLLEARADFQKLLAEELGPNDPDPWVAAHRDAKAELAQLEGLIPQVTLSLASPGSVDDRADVDGQPFLWAKPLELNPGEHTVHIASTPPYEQKFSIAEGEKKDVTITPTTASQRTIEPHPIKPPPGGEPKSIIVPAQPGSIVPGAVVLSLGIAAVVTGGVFMGVALAARGDVDPACAVANDPGCVGDVFRDSDAANTRAGLFGNTSTGLFIGGGVAGAVGAVLLVVRPGGTPETTKPVEVTVGPAFVGLRGAF